MGRVAARSRLSARFQNQIETALTDDNQGRGRILLSASKEVAEGARVAMLFAEGLFRLDVCPRSDTLVTVVRNLSAGELRMSERQARRPIDIQSGGRNEVAAPWPTRLDVEFVLVGSGNAVKATITIETLRHLTRGTLRVTAQAIVREVEVPQ